MDDDGAGTVGTAASEGSEPELGADTPDTPDTPDASGGPRGKRGVRLGAVAAVVLAMAAAAAIGLGVTTVVRGSVPADARIPSPPAKNNAFVADNKGALEDVQDNIVKWSARGIVTLRSGSGAELGSGFVITRSGYVLAADHGLSGAGTLTARLAMSGKTYPAKVVGSDPPANLALLQLSGGTAFTPVKIGTANDVKLRDQVASVGGNFKAKGLLMTIGAITGIDKPVLLDGQKVTGLLETSSLAVPANELGGPLFNQSGQVLGLSVAASTVEGHGAGDGYAIPIGSALQVARKIAGQ